MNIIILLIGFLTTLRQMNVNQVCMKDFQENSLKSFECGLTFLGKGKWLRGGNCKQIAWDKVIPIMQQALASGRHHNIFTTFESKP